MKALSNSVIVKPMKNKTNKGNIVVADIGKTSNETGEVVSVGPGVMNMFGHFIETTLKVGDIVVLPVVGFTRFKHENVEYYVGKEHELHAQL